MINYYGVIKWAWAKSCWYFVEAKPKFGGCKPKIFKATVPFDQSEGRFIVKKAPASVFN